MQVWRRAAGVPPPSPLSPSSPRPAALDAPPSPPCPPKSTRPPAHLAHQLEAAEVHFDVEAAARHQHSHLIKRGHSIARGRALRGRARACGRAG